MRSDESWRIHEAQLDATCCCVYGSSHGEYKSRTVPHKRDTTVVSEMLFHY